MPSSQMRSGRTHSGDSHPECRADVPTLLRRAFAGENLTLDRDDYSLHELTQVALALRPEAGLAITRGAMMSPLERASVASVGRGRVVFL